MSTDSDTSLEFRAFCDICRESSPWFEVATGADQWRSDHFDEVHPDNPMKRQNCRIQRFPANTNSRRPHDDREK